MMIGDESVGDNDDDEAGPNVYIPAAPQDLEWEEDATLKYLKIQLPEVVVGEPGFSRSGMAS